MIRLSHRHPILPLPLIPYQAFMGFSFIGIGRSGYYTVTISYLYLPLHIRHSWEFSFSGIGRSGYHIVTLSYLYLPLHISVHGSFVTTFVKLY